MAVRAYGISMGDLSEHFSRSEFACSCKCGQDTVDYMLLVVLEHLREHFGKPVFITEKGGNRCPMLNAIAGGADKSYHLIGKAADVQVEDVTPEDVYEFLCLNYPNSLGFGLYERHVHVDSRERPARWID